MWYDNIDAKYLMQNYDMEIRHLQDFVHKVQTDKPTLEFMPYIAY